MISVLKRVLILCEDGKSSLLYLKAFKTDEEIKRQLSSVSIEVYQPENFSPLGLVMEAKKKKLKAKRDRNPYDQIWIVFDKDKHQKIPETLNMAQANKINFVISIICFEYWIILHYEQTTRAFHNCTELLKYLTKSHFKDYSKEKNFFQELKHRIPSAINNGEWVERQCEPDLAQGIKVYNLSAYTNMHKLIKILLYPEKFLFK